MSDDRTSEAADCLGERDAGSPSGRISATFSLTELKDTVGVGDTDRDELGTISADDPRRICIVFGCDRIKDLVTP